jgi:hypothetical protein
MLTNKVKPFCSSFIGVMVAHLMTGRILDNALKVSASRLTLKRVLTFMKSHTGRNITRVGRIIACI